MDNPKLRALVVDDDNIARRAHQVLLEQAGFKVTCAENGEQAVKLAHQQFHLICIDIDMPIMDGLTATTAIRRQRESFSTIIIGLSSHNEDEYKSACLAAGMDAFLTKPARLDSLLPLIPLQIAA